MSPQPAQSRGPLRFIVLIVGCAAFFADFYCQDIPGVLRNQFLKKFSSESSGDSEYVFNLLYSVYSFPNMLLPFLAGMLVDKFGYRLMNILFCLLVTLGQVFLYLGIVGDSAALMVFGRFVFGLGGEALNVTIGILLVCWFKGKELSFSQGFNLSFARFGSVLNCLISPILANKSLESPVLFAVVVAVISTIGAILVSVIDESYEKAHPESVEVVEHNPTLLEAISSIGEFSKAFWILTALVCSLYLTVIPFNMVASGFFEDTWLNTPNVNAEDRSRIAGQLMSIPMLISSFMFPVVGFYVDNNGKRIKLLTLSAALGLAAHLLFVQIYPVIPLIILGFSYGIFGAVLWPTVVFLVPRDKLGSAYGLIQSVQNLTLAFCPLLIAIIKSSSNSYTNVIMLFAFFSVVSLTFCYALMKEDKKYRFSLDSSNQVALTNYLDNPRGKPFDHNRVKDDRFSDTSSIYGSTDEEDYSRFVIQPQFD